ncbi:M18 family aminopeptidase [Candidatus Poriferisodalis sp.]|uniref:M18 family aminopeptidase n=1 Tax=Candidatus Poriferisodalis sp. TaxID=3101277 RepID=UPI003B0256F5
MLDSLLAFIEASPSPYHAAVAAVDRLRAAGFAETERSASWRGLDAARGIVMRDGGTVVAVRTAQRVDPDRLRFGVIGAHTDSPNLRLRPQPDAIAYGYRQLRVEVYGGALLNSWLDRDLGLSGRVVLRGGDGVVPRHDRPASDVRASELADRGSTAVLWRSDRPLLRVPQLAIHLDREANDGLTLNRQQHLTPVWGLDERSANEPTGSEAKAGEPEASEPRASRPSAGGFREFLADELDVEPDAVLAWDIMAHDLAAPTRLGRDGEMYAAGRIDNLASCHAAVAALSGLGSPPDHTAAVVVLFDHEEIGSDSATGAGSPMLSDALERIAGWLGADREQYLRAAARSVCASADGAHAVHPNYPERHEPGHVPLLNGGPVIKSNANVRYATDARTGARFIAACEAASVPYQLYSHRGDLPCGTTIGPITASRLGMSVVDVGSPQLSMHSARELGGSDDPAMLTAALTAFLADA